MRIGIEGQRLFRPNKHGMDMVALELIRNLQALDCENEYFIFVKPDVDSGVLHESANVKIIPVEGGFYPLWEQFALPKAAQKYGCDLLHCTSNTAPIWCSTPLMITLHDIIYMERGWLEILRGKGSLYQKFGNVYRRMVVPRILANSKRIVTVSNFEKERINEFFKGQLGNRLRAVYNGVSTHFKPVVDETERLRIKTTYHLPDRYCFFLGNTDPKKNTEGTLKAFSDYRKQTQIDLKLVMIDFDRDSLLAILQAIGDTDLLEHIVLTGYVPNTDLPGIYSQCSFFLYTSLRESFGIPMLEAMACGVPVITSNTSCMPEIADDAALLVNPFVPSEITEAMIQLTNDADLRKALIDKGIVRAASFSWKTMAKQVLQLYLEIEREKSKN